MNWTGCSHRCGYSPSLWLFRVVPSVGRLSSFYTNHFYNCENHGEVNIFRLRIFLDQNLFHSCGQENITRAIAGCSPSCFCPTEWVPGFVLHGAQKLHAQTSSSCQDDSSKK